MNEMRDDCESGEGMQTVATKGTRVAVGDSIVEEMMIIAMNQSTINMS
jgi:hypothetical protein